MPSAPIDLYKLHKEEYVSPKTPQLVRTKSANYLTIRGRGEPGGEKFTACLGALYNVAFTIKMAQKFSGQDYKVCKLEGIWWGNRSTLDFIHEPAKEWNWKLLIRTPDFINPNHLRETETSLLKKGKSPQVREVKLETLQEGLCVQMLHTGPYAEEGSTLSKMKEFAQQNGLAFQGPHHEIYLSDPRRVAPARLKTILRMPVG